MQAVALLVNREFGDEVSFDSRRLHQIGDAELLGFVQICFFSEVILLTFVHMFCYADYAPEMIKCPAEATWPVYVLRSIFALIALYMISLLRTIHDRLHIRNEIVLCWTVFIPLYILSMLAAYLPGKLPQVPMFGRLFWVWLLVIVCHTVSVTLPGIGAALYWHRSRRHFASQMQMLDKVWLANMNMSITPVAFSKCRAISSFQGPPCGR